MTAQLRNRVRRVVAVLERTAARGALKKFKILDVLKVRDQTYQLLVDAGSGGKLAITVYPHPPMRIFSNSTSVQWLESDLSATQIKAIHKAIKDFVATEAAVKTAAKPKTREQILAEAAKAAASMKNEIEFDLFGLMEYGRDVSGNDIEMDWYLDSDVGLESYYIRAGDWMRKRGYDKLSGPGYEHLSEDVEEVFREHAPKPTFSFKVGKVLVLTDLVVPVADIYSAAASERPVDVVAAFNESEYGQQVRDAGFTDADLRKLLIHAGKTNVGGYIILGVISDNVVNGVTITTEIKGTPVLALKTHGYGIYVKGSKSYTFHLDADSLVSHIDYGASSLGAATKTRDWEYR